MQIKKSLGVYVQRTVGKQVQIRARRFGAALFAGCVLCCLPALAQTNLGGIVGTVTDQSGAAIVSAAVTVTNTDTGVSRNLTTNSAGQYAAPSLNPGTYSVRAVANGFAASLHSNIVVGVGSEVRVDLTLMPGSQTQTVTVTAAAPIVTTENATLGNALTTENLTDVPVNGRSIQKLMDMVPGSVSRDGNDFDFNGAVDQANNYIFDGVQELNPYGSGPIAGGTAGFTEATIVPIDAVQEAHIETNPDAQFGGKVGGNMNMGIKSGTNAIHGTAFALGRDSALEATPRFTTQKPADTFEQFGGTVGGPIKKDKLFYFGAYEGQRYSVGIPGDFKRPTSLPGLGAAQSIPDALSGLASHGVTPSALSLNLAGCHATAPFTPCTSGIFNNSTSAFLIPGFLPNTGGSDNGIGKIDYHPNDKNSINGEYYSAIGTSLQSAGSPSSQAEPYWDKARYTHAQLGRVVWVYTPNSTWVNEMRFGVDREYSYGDPAECTNNLGQPNYAATYNFIIQPIPKPLCGFPQMTISGLSGLGTGAAGEINLAWTPISGVDTVSYIHGTHSFKFGVDITDGVFNGVTMAPYVTGLLKFGTIKPFSGATPLQDFLAGVVSNSQIQNGIPNINGDLNDYALFFQDDWRARHNLTVNLGLRWDIMPALSVGANQVGTFSASQGMLQVGNQVSSLYPTDYKNFGPRLGLAWDITGNGTTVVRAGGSVLYEEYPINEYDASNHAAATQTIPTGYKLYDANGNLLPSPGNLTNGYLVGVGNKLVNWTPGVPVFQTGSSSLACGNGVGTNPAPCTIYPVDQNFKPGYLATWTLGVQHAFTSNVALNVAYVGTKGERMPQNLDVNQAAPGAGTSTAIQTGRPFYSQFPYLGEIITTTDTGISNYDALQVGLNLRAAHGLNGLINYTYSHELSDFPDDYGGWVMDSANPALDYGAAPFDFRHALNFQLTYDIPAVTTKTHLLDGWTVSTVVSVLSATPWSPADSSFDFPGINEINGAGAVLDRWSILGNPGNIRSGTNPLPCFGVPGSAFAGTSNCAAVTSMAAMPALCVQAATQEPVNPRVPGSSGLASLAQAGCYYMNGTAIVPPAQGTFGNMGFDVLRTGLPFREWDMAIQKSFKVTERLTAQFRIAAYNITNNTIYDVPQNDLSAPSSFGATTDLNNSGDPVLGEGGPRQVNLELHFAF